MNWISLLIGAGLGILLRLLVPPSDLLLAVLGGAGGYIIWGVLR